MYSCVQNDSSAFSKIDIKRRILISHTWTCIRNTAYSFPTEERKKKKCQLLPLFHRKVKKSDNRSWLWGVQWVSPWTGERGEQKRKCRKGWLLSLNDQKFFTTVSKTRKTWKKLENYHSNGSKNGPNSKARVNDLLLSNQRRTKCPPTNPHVQISYQENASAKARCWKKWLVVDRKHIKN